MTAPALAPGKPCPHCGKPSIEQYKPFCSTRCADVDLHRWLSGVYAIPLKEEDEEESKPRDASEDEPS